MSKPKLSSHIDQKYKDVSTKEIYSFLEADNDIIYSAITPNLVIRGKSNGKTKIVRYLEEFVADVGTTSTSAFIRQQSPSGKLILERTNLARYFIGVMNFPGLNDSAHEFSEGVQLLRDCMVELGLMHSQNIVDPLGKYFNGKEHNYECFNRLIEVLRKRLTVENFTKRIRRRKEQSKRQFDSGRKYIASLFHRHSRILVLRVDFGYRDGIDNLDEPFTSKKSIEEVRFDFHRFLNNRRSNQIFDHLIGYIWKLEQGVTKGYHFHTILFFDGSIVHKDEYIAQKIGEYWQDSVTKGAGLFHNCNRYKKGYRKLGIGMINHDDHELRDNLLSALIYLTKSEQYLRVRTPGFRTFGTGLVKERNSRAGRPRRGSGGALDADVIPQLS